MNPFNMKNNVIYSSLALLLIFTGAITLTGCKTTEKPEVFKPIDYTEEDAVLDEIESIRDLSETQIIKALWKSSILLEKVPENTEVQNLFNFIKEKSIQELESERKKAKEESSSIREKLNAQKLYDSMKAVLKDSEKIEKTEIDISEVPGLNSSGKEKNKAKVSELIKGTVTVYVDKGIKIEKGMGYTDAVLGSGFFISSDGYIVTNHHVIEDMVEKKSKGYSRLYIKLAEDPDTRIPAKVIGWDSTLDLALIKTEVEAPYVFTLGSSKDLDTGDRVYAIGSPLGLDRTLTSGIISAKDRRLFTAGTVFQVDAAVNSGNSGGPLIDEYGRVQAIVFAGVQNYQGLNFAIPVEYLKSSLPFLYAGGEREHPWIGSYGRTQREPGSGRANEGLTINYTLPGGSANYSGLKEDMTIIKLNDTPITSLDDFQIKAMSLEADSIVRITTKDEKNELKEFPVYLDKRPSSPGYEVYKHDLLKDALLPILGMQMVHASSSSSKHYAITKILKSSIADEAGFSETDPVDILNVQLNEDKSAIYIELYAKKRKNGFLDVSIGLSASLDSPYYF